MEEMKEDNGRIEENGEEETMEKDEVKRRKKR